MPISNTLEFFVKMKDMMSGGLAKIAKNAKQSLSSVQGDINKTIKKNEQLADSFDKVDRKASSSGGGLLRWAKGLAVAAGAMALMQSSARAYMNYEATGKSFEVLAGNRGIGQTLTSELNKLQQNTILGPEVFKNAQTMMGFGIGADKVLPYMNMLGQVSMGNADRMQSLTLAFSQVSAATKLTGQDLLQFVNAGFNPLYEISKMTGQSMGDLKKKMEDGQISFQMVADAFAHATGKGGLFNGMLDQMAETTTGKLAMLEGNWESLKIAMGERMAPAVNFALDSLGGIVSTVKKWVEIPVEQRLTDQINKIKALQGELFSANVPQQRQVELLKELEQINPKIVEGISKQAIEYDKLAKNIDNVTGALKSKIALEAFDKEKAGVIATYTEAKRKQDESHQKAFAMAFAALPQDVIKNRSLTPMQKMQIGANLLKEQHEKNGVVYNAAGPGGKATVSKATDAYNTYQQLVKENEKAKTVVGKVGGEYNAIMQTRQAIEESLNSVLSIKAVTPKDIVPTNNTNTNTTTNTTGKDVAGGITGGGARTVNISIGKMVEKIEIHTQDAATAYDDVERRVEEMFLRILNSGANLQ